MFAAQWGARDITASMANKLKKTAYRITISGASRMFLW